MGRSGETGIGGLSSEVVQVNGLDPVELQHPCEGVEHLLGGGFRLPLFQACVVSGADPRELGELFTSQAGNPASGSERA